MTLVHLSDIHFPFLADPKWDGRWEALVTRIHDHKPEVILITGDVLDLAWWPFSGTSRLRNFYDNYVAAAFEGAQIIHVPGNHDIKPFKGLGAVDPALKAQHSAVPGGALGWQPPVSNILHVFTADSNYSSLFARGRVPAAVLESAALPSECASASHIHIFAMHHHVVPEAKRQGENSLTADERKLGLDDRDRLLSSSRSSDARVLVSWCSECDEGGLARLQSPPRTIRRLL